MRIATQKRGAVSLHIASLKLAFSFISHQKRSYQTKMHRLQKLAERFAQNLFSFPMNRILSIQAFSAKTFQIILRNLEAKIFRENFIFASKFLKMIRKVLAENACIERMRFIGNTEKTLFESFC